LAALEDPNLDARVALPLWRPQPDSVLRLVACPVHECEQSRPFSLWRIAGRKSLCHDGHCLLLEIAVAGCTTRIALPNELSEGDGYAHVIRVDVHATRRWRDAQRCEALLQARMAPHGDAVKTRLDRVAIAHMRSLQALDGALAGASQREIAIVIFGGLRIDAGWHADSELRAQIRYLIRRGRAFMSGGYVRLLGGAPRNTPRTSVAVKGGGR